jgi:L-histidine Nalpha-methyltransferase
MLSSSASAECAVCDRYHGTPAETMAQDVMSGLTADQKYIPSKYFYDERGSKLFEEICRLPEYYQTRTELELLSAYSGEIVRGLRHGDVIELGAGANWKVRVLLDALGHRRRSDMRYVPVDVCTSALAQSSAELAGVYPELKVNELVTDFTRDLHCIQSDRPKLVLFFGSTIGNLDEQESSSFLKGVASALNPGDRFLLGLDMVKPVEILEAAYNDSQGVTAEFNRNILLVVNRELGGRFNPNAFEHIALYNHESERMEMHLRAERDLRVEVAAINASLEFKKGETIRTEICRKFRRDAAQEMISEAGMRVNRWYSDPNGWFSLVEAVLDRP